jgi:hypothetical protein
MRQDYGRVAVSTGKARVGSQRARWNQTNQQRLGSMAGLFAFRRKKIVEIVFHQQKVPVLLCGSLDDLA